MSKKQKVFDEIVRQYEDLTRPSVTISSVFYSLGGLTDPEIRPAIIALEEEGKIIVHRPSQMIDVVEE